MTSRHATTWALLATAILFAAMPFFTPFNGFDPDRFPIPQNDPPAQPAGWAFSIWGVIYLWLIASAVFGAFRRIDDPAWAPARPWLLASLAIGVPWLPVAGTSPVAAFVMIWAMQITAVVALYKSPLQDRWLLRAPIGLYAGWLTAASWVSVALNGAGFGLVAGEWVWAIIAICGAFAMTVAVLATFPVVPAFAAAVVWALVAVAVKAASDYVLIAVLAGLGALVIAGLAVRNARSNALS